MVPGPKDDEDVVPSAWKYNIPVIIVAVLGLILSIAAFSYESHRMRDDADKQAASEVDLTSQRASRQLGQVSGSMEAFQGLFAASPEVSEKEFRAFARKTLGGDTGITAIGYAPLVSRQYTELPLTYIAPATDQKRFAGTELQRIPGLETGISSARDSGVTHIEELPAGLASQQVQLVALTPLYTGGVVPPDVAQRQARWEGLVTGALPVAAWMDRSSATVDAADTALTLMRVSARQAEPVWSNEGEALSEAPEDWITKSVLTLSDDEEYVLVGQPTPALVAAQGSWRPWTALAVGLLMTVLLCVLLYRRLGAERVGRTADELQAATNRLLYLAERDALTGLPHRDGLLSWLDAWDEKDPDRSLGLCFIDIDGFKEVNTTWGHPTGDFVLRQIGQRLGVFADSKDCVVARMGGDEFVVMRALDRGSLDGLANMVQTVISEPLSVGDQNVQLSSSMGIVVRPEDGRTLDTLLANADIALRVAKLDPSDSVIHYDPLMAAEGAAHRHMANALRLALRRPDDHFFLQYQPQVDMRTGRLVGSEALVRWRDENGQLVSPATFIPLASEYGLMDSLGRWVLERACDTVAHWRKETQAVISVNIDATQLVDGFSQEVAKVTRERGVEPEWIVFELTESAAMRPEAENELDRLRDLGVSISIDDFGTGFSSLSRLADLPTHELKIDRGFVDSLTESHESLEIVRTVVALAAALELQTLAEGVETTEQASILLNEGVLVAQGYLFSKPVSERQCQRLWRTGVSIPSDTGRA